MHGMVEHERYCIDVLTRIRAIQAALDRVALELLDTMRATAWWGPTTSRRSSPR